MPLLTISQKSKPPPDKGFNRQRIRIDQRGDLRIRSKVPLIIALFGSMVNRECASITFNHSQGGMCMEAPEPFKSGSVLHIRLGSAPAEQICCGSWSNLRASTLAEVKWCREFCDQFKTGYRIGVKYF